MNILKDKFYLTLLFLCIISVIPYFFSLKYPFQFDDYPTIFEDTSLDNLSEIFKVKLSERPVRKISLIFDRFFYKDKVYFYRLENIFLYIMTIFLTALMIYHLTGNKIFSYFSVFLFSLHPVHVENIMIITHKKELLLYIFSMLSFLSHIKGKNILSFIFFLLALLSKEVAIILPLNFFVYDRIFDRKINSKFYIFIFSFILLSFIFLIFFGSIFGFYIPAFSKMGDFFKTNRMLRDADYLDILKIQPYLFTKYLKQLFIPYPLLVDYYVPVSENNLKIFLFSLIFLIIIISLMIRLKKEKFLLFSFMFFVITYIPVANFIPVLNLFADRYLFLPSFSLILFFYFIFQKTKKFATYIFIPFLILFLFLTLTYIPNFKSEISLWSHVVKYNPKSIVGTNNLGLYYMKSGNIPDGEKYLLKSFQLDSLYIFNLINLGALYASKKDYEKSLYFLEKAKEIEPGNVKVLYNLGLTYKNLGMSIRARRMMETIIDLSPYSSLAYNNLGASFFNEGYLSEKLFRIFISSGLYGILPIQLDNLFESYNNAKNAFFKGNQIDKDYIKLKENYRLLSEKIKGSL